MARAGEPITMVCTVLRVEPPLLVEHTHRAPGSTMLWELEAVDYGCILRLSHTLPDVQEAIDNCYLVGLQTSLDRLAPALSGRPAPWNWDSFGADTMHVAVAPIEIGRGGKLWESPDDLLDRFHRETIPSPSGIIHHLFWHR